VQLDKNKFPGKDLSKLSEGGANYNLSDRRKILLARALYQKPDIFLFDGVFEGMDSLEKKEFFTRVCLRELRSSTILFTSNERTLARLSDRIMVLNEGGLGQLGTIDELDLQGTQGLFYSITTSDNVMGGKTTGMSKLLESADDANIIKGKLSDVSLSTTKNVSKNTEQ